MTTITATEFRVGAVLGSGFRVLFRNIVPFWVICVIVMAPAFVFVLAGGAGSQVAIWQSGARGIVVLILDALLTYAAMAALVYGTVQELRGQTISMGPCIRRGLALMLPVLGVMILTVVIVALGFVLLVIPGIILYTMLWVAVPAAVVEQPGVFASLSRSAELTKGFRWQILGIVVLLLLLEFAATFVVLFLVPMAFVAIGFEGWAWMSFIAVDWAMQAFFTALTAVMGAVAYHDLRVAKEGLDTEQIAAVFD